MRRLIHSQMSTEAKIGILQVVLAVPILITAWFTVLDRPKLVYETRHQTPFIFQTSGPSPRGWQRLAGNLLILVIENIGYRPSTDIRGSISLPGRILTADKNIFHPVYCNPNLNSETSKISITIDRCAQEYPVEVFILYERSKNEQPTIAFADDLGAVPRVSSIQQEKDRWKWRFIYSLIVFGIFNGFLVSSRLNKRFSTKIASRESQVSLLISEVRTRLERGDLNRAGRLLRQAKVLAPNIPQIYILLGRLRKREALDIDAETRSDSARTLMMEAKDFCTKAIKINPSYESAYYNRSCYRSRLREPVQEIFADLSMAIELYPQNKALALEDADFTSNENFAELRTLIEEL